MAEGENPKRAVARITFISLFRGGIGFLSQIVIAARFGASAQVDAYIAAITPAQVLGDFILGGTLGVTLVPVFTRYKMQDQEEAWSWGRSILLLSFIGFLRGLFRLVLSHPIIKNLCMFYDLTGDKPMNSGPPCRKINAADSYLLIFHNYFSSGYASL